MLPTVFVHFLYLVLHQGKTCPSEIPHRHRDRVHQIVMLGFWEPHALAYDLVSPCFIGAVDQSFLEQMLHRIKPSPFVDRAHGFHLNAKVLTRIHPSKLPRNWLAHSGVFYQDCLDFPPKARLRHLGDQFWHF